jgi:alanine dehydrogenase
MTVDPSDDGAFVLSHAAVSELIRSVSLRDFASELVSAIEATYGDRYLRSIERTGWTQQLDTLEVMGCKSVDYTCVKVISSNPSLASAEIPAVAGTLVCTDADADRARLVCDTAILTPFRTAAGTAVVLKRLKPRPISIAIIGAGLEGASHALLLALLFRDVKHVTFIDRDPSRATAASEEVTQILGRADPGRDIEIIACEGNSDVNGLYEADVIVTATYGASTVCDLRDATKEQGTPFIAAVGADLQNKRELDDSIYLDARFVADDLAQCLRQGELQHAAPLLGLSRDEIDAHKTHGGKLLDGRIIGVEDLLARGRSFSQRSELVTVYDSTGFSGQDLAVARLMIKLCDARGIKRVPWNPGKTAFLADVLPEVSVAKSRAT